VHEHPKLTTASKLRSANRGVRVTPQKPDRQELFDGTPSRDGEHLGRIHCRHLRAAEREDEGRAPRPGADVEHLAILMRPTMARQHLRLRPAMSSPIGPPNRRSSNVRAISGSGTRSSCNAFVERSRSRDVLDGHAGGRCRHQRCARPARALEARRRSIRLGQLTRLTADGRRPRMVGEAGQNAVGAS
jgi:hypothetical protein